MNKQQQPTTKPQTILQTDTAKYPELSDVQLEVVAGGQAPNYCHVDKDHRRHCGGK